MKKANNSKTGSITTPLLKDMLEQDKANSKANSDKVSIGQKPLDPPALYEDSGDAYNPDFTYPQQ
jgi:hypothetical protein